MKDPYVELVKIIKERGADDNPPSLQLGTMVGSNILKIGDLQIDSSNLLINEYWKGKLVSGDSVAALAIKDNQTFIILCKVVVP